MYKQNTPVLAMYDVRGIQSYIFSTSEVKDAIGASMIVEHIIEEALAYAVNRMKEVRQVETDLIWVCEDGVKEYEEKGMDVQVLYIGGGNAYVAYNSRELCIAINKLMSRYIIEKTFSLQLAIAIVDKTENYKEDYDNIMAQMGKVKANMVVSKPLGALPIVEIDVNTGYAKNGKASLEVALKKEKEAKKRQKVEQAKRIFDNYVTEKGVDSTLAVVHIDGNNMGLRIRELMKEKKSYVEAVSEMRLISHHINSSYKNVFEEMKNHFNSMGNVVLEVLVAGDDITYICNGKMALKTVEYYTEKIAGYAMNGKTDKESIEKYGFSVCAGVAYMGSHFPFSEGYAVAEACCESAKDEAKKIENTSGKRIGNWVDFHICKSIHAKNLEGIREKEYITATGEQLLIRPYYIPVANLEQDAVLKKLGESAKSMRSLAKNIHYFQNSDRFPTSFAKQLRNTYSLGEMQVEALNSFLESRDHWMPDRTKESEKNEMYHKPEKGRKTAKWYDALEILELYPEKGEAQ